MIATPLRRDARTPLFTRLLALGLLALAALGQSGCSPVGVLAGAGAGTAVVASQERGLSGGIEDTRIRVQINDLWLRESEELYRKVQLQVQEGRVLLSGVVPTPEMRLTAVRLAWQADGVKEVINEIEVADSSSFGSYARDSWISTQLRTRLLFDREVSSLNYSIEVVNQVVYLMGVAQDQAELERVADHARNLAYVRRVVSYVRVKDAQGQVPEAPSEPEDQGPGANPEPEPGTIEDAPSYDPVEVEELSALPDDRRAAA